MISLRKKIKRATLLVSYTLFDTNPHGAGLIVSKYRSKKLSELPSYILENIREVNNLKDVVITSIINIDNLI